jgi:2-keto-4-pentenoate hydratase
LPSAIDRKQEGEFVLLGSLVETKWVERGDVVTIEQPGIGVATARFV